MLEAPVKISEPNNGAQPLTTQRFSNEAWTATPDVEAGAGDVRNVLVTIKEPAAEQSDNKKDLPKETPSESEIDRMIKQLQGKDYSLRQEAADQLKKSGPPALKALLPMVQHRDADVRSRATNVILEHIGEYHRPAFGIDIDNVRLVAIPRIVEWSKNMDRETLEQRVPMMKALSECVLDPRSGLARDYAKSIADNLNLQVKAITHGGRRLRIEGAFGEVVTPKQLSVLKDLPALEDISFSVNLKVGDDAVKALSEMTNIKRLGLFNSAMSDDALDLIATMPNLQELDLSQTKISDKAVEKLKACKNLKSLSLAFAPIGDEAMAHLGQMSKLELLCVSCTGNVTDQGMASISGLRELRELRLSHTKISDDGFKSVSQLSKLERISVHGVKMTDQGIANMGDMPSLKEFSGGKETITDASMKTIATWSNLEKLDIDSTQLTAVGIAELHKLKKLQELSIGFTDVNDDAIKELAKLEGLRVLRLHGCKNLTDACVDDLCKMTNLTKVNLSGSRISPKGMDRLRKALPQCEVYPAPVQQ